MRSYRVTLVFKDGSKSEYSVSTWKSLQGAMSQEVYRFEDRSLGVEQIRVEDPGGSCIWSRYV